METRVPYPAWLVLSQDLCVSCADLLISVMALGSHLFPIPDCSHTILCFCIPKQQQRTPPSQKNTRLHGLRRKFLTQFCSSGCRAFMRMTKGVLVAVAHHKTKSGLVKVPFVLCQISSECRGGEVLAELLPQLYLPTPIWNKMVKVSRNFRTTPCTSVQHRLDSWDGKKSSFFKTWILEYEVAALRHVQTRHPKYLFSSPYLW